MIDIISFEFTDWSAIDGTLKKKEYMDYKLKYIFQEHYSNNEVYPYRYIVIIEKKK